MAWNWKPAPATRSLVEAVKRYAGPDYRKAVILPRDAEFLTEVEPEVVHYEVVRAGGK